MTDEKPSAAEQLVIFKTDAAAFWLEVSRAITEAPYQHDWIPASLGTRKCRLCNRWVDLRDCPNGTPPVDGCNYPPDLTKPPEVVAFRLRNKAVMETDAETWDKAKGDLWYATGHPHGWSMNHVDWFADFATPEQWIACCLVALGKWRQ